MSDEKEKLWREEFESLPRNKFHSHEKNERGEYVDHILELKWHYFFAIKTTIVL